MSKNIRSINSMKNGPKRQNAIKSLTKKGTTSQGKPGKPLATLGSNSSVRKGKMSVGPIVGTNAAKANTLKSNTKSKMMSKKPMGASKAIGNLGGKVAGRMNNGGKARRVS